MEGRSNIYGREGYVSGMGYKRQSKGGHNIIIIRIIYNSIVVIVNKLIK